MHVTFERLSDEPGIEVIDRVERQRYRLLTPEPVTPTPADTDGFRFPVDRAVTFETSSLALSAVVPVIVRDGDGEMVAEVGNADSVALPDGTYSLDVCTQMKTYVRVTAAPNVSTEENNTSITFDGPRRVIIGVRSRHDRPAATVTTTTDPADAMAAIETFGSALKTTSPERSFPTLRGHPPAVALGDELDVPSGIERPETGVTLELPPTLSAAVVAAPLAYYLGAAVEPGPSPRLLTDDGFEHPLDGPDGYERAVERTLKQLFVLDCVTRTEGFYQVPLDERHQLAPGLDLEFDALYERSLSDQVAAYLSVPYDAVADHVPEWRLTTHVDPNPEAVRSLPFLVDDLAVVRTRPDGRDDIEQSPAAGCRTFSRDDVVTRSAGDSDGQPQYVQPRASSSVEQAWIGDSIPIGASKPTVEAFRNRLDRSPAEGNIGVTVVENDQRMAAERRTADEVYGNRGDRHDVPLDVTVRRELTRTELHDVLTEPTELLHYVGHADTDGLRCTDGSLDVRAVDDVAVETFVLNACDSYDQGLALVEHGAIGGIVTLNEVVNDHAVPVGGTMARLLNLGFPLQVALTVARDVSPAGGQYIVVGDGGITVTQAPGKTPTLLDIAVCDDGYEAELKTYVTDDCGLGSMFIPFLADNDRYYLNPASIGPVRVGRDELDEFLELESIPVRVGDDLYWSTDADLDDVL